MYDITRFSFEDMIECGTLLRSLGANATSMEEVAARVVAHFYEGMRGPDGERVMPLVRFYKTHAYGALPPELQRFADGVLDQKQRDDTRCLTLLATTGDAPAWRARASSLGHQAIPLPSEEILVRLPMIHGLLEQFGLDARAIVAPYTPLLVDADQRTFNVFHVPDAAGSPFIPAQDFVRAHRVRSVLGFGGMLPGQDLFAVIMFSRAAIPREAAELFQTLALGVKLALHPFLDGREFAAPEAAA